MTTTKRTKNIKRLNNPVFLRKSVKSGMSVREIAIQLGMSRTTVREKLREFDIPPVVRPHKAL